MEYLLPTEAFRDLFHHTHASAVHRKRNYKLEREIRSSLHSELPRLCSDIYLVLNAVIGLAILLKTMDDEASLVPVRKTTASVATMLIKDEETNAALSTNLERSTSTL